MNVRQHAVVTGASSGIGLAIATELCKLNWAVTLITRDGRIPDAITEVSGRSKGIVHAIKCDLSEPSQVIWAAEATKQLRKDVSLLVNAAGVQSWRRVTIGSSLELDFATNVLAPFILTERLASALALRQNAKVLNIGSVVHLWGRINLADLQSISKFDPNQRYYDTKLMLTALSFAFARRLENQRITVIVMEPGMTRTRFSRHFEGLYGFMAWVVRPFLRDPRDVAMEVIEMLDDPLPPRSEPYYLYRRREGKVNPVAKDMTIQERVFAACAEKQFELDARPVD